MSLGTGAQEWKKSTPHTIRLPPASGYVLVDTALQWAVLFVCDQDDSNSQANSVIDALKCTPDVDQGRILIAIKFSLQLDYRISRRCRHSNAKEQGASCKKLNS